MGYQVGYHRGSITMFRRGTCFDHDPNSAKPAEFGYDLDFPPCEETWGQGLVVFHNPNAICPLPQHFFPEAVSHYFEDGQTVVDVPRVPLVPFASVTAIVAAEPDPLDPEKPPKPGLRSIRLDEFETLSPPRRARTLITSQEKEWFASDDRRVIGTVAQDLVDNDWLYALFIRRGDGKLETEDVPCSIPTRTEAREGLLDSMVGALDSLKSHDGA
jgi:hypothetical protein